MLTNASVIEIIWTVVTIFGTTVNVIALLDAIADSDALARSKRNGPLRLLANGRTRNEISCVLRQGVWAFIGITAMLLPAAPGSPTPTVIALLITGALIAATMADVLTSTLDRADRWRLRRMISEESRTLDRRASERS